MSSEEKVKLLEELLEMEENELSLETELADVEEWDSLAVLSFLAVAKKKFNKIITVEEVKELKTIGDICELLN